ncbi:MAG: hypothetical protein AAF429_00730 [Pseudomonadota bacterium]
MKLTTKLAALALLAVTACTTQEVVYAPDIEVQSKAYVHGGQPSVTLLTMVNNATGSGGHSAVMINGSQRVMYDPAGRFKDSRVAERYDVLYGVTPEVLQRYNSFHSRKTHHVLIQELPVSLATANAVIQSALQQGNSPDALCANNTAHLLSRVPQFSNIRRTFFPKALAANFGNYPGVETSRYYEDDEGQNYQ